MIAGLKVELGFDRVDLVSGDGRNDVNEGVDYRSMLGKIEGRELLDMADDGLGLNHPLIFPYNISIV
jgi:hypothetical protein